MSTIQAATMRGKPYRLPLFPSVNSAILDMSIPSVNEKDTYRFPPGPLPVPLAIVKPMLYWQTGSRKIAGSIGTDITKVYVTLCKKLVNRYGEI